MKRWRFFFHYNKQTGNMTVHFRGQCNSVTYVDCRVPCNSKYNKTQPKLVMRGFAHAVHLSHDTATIL